MSPNWSDHLEMKLWVDRQTDLQTNRWSARQTARQQDRQILISIERLLSHLFSTSELFLFLLTECNINICSSFNSSTFFIFQHNYLSKHNSIISFCKRRKFITESFSLCYLQHYQVTQILIYLMDLSS